MSHVGEQLRSEREAQQRTRAEVARDTGILIHHLSALEHGSFDTLPDDETVAGFVRTYAEYLGFQPDEPVAEFWAERRAEAPVAQEPVTEDPTPTPPADEARRFPWTWVLSAVAALVVIVAAVSLQGGGDEKPTPVETPPAATPDPVEADPVVERQAPPPEPTPPPEAPGEPAVAPSTSGMRIAEYGVGAGVENRRLVGERDRFRPGDRVWFWTRVEGGAKGDRIRHVWLLDGREMSSVELAVGSPNWRTQSSKTLFGGSAGRWTVEARDASGRVLARDAFVCRD